MGGAQRNARTVASLRGAERAWGLKGCVCVWRGYPALYASPGLARWRTTSPVTPWCQPGKTRSRSIDRKENKGSVCVVGGGSLE